MVQVQKQYDGYNCGSLAIQFATDAMNGLFLVDSSFDACLMRSHSLQCLETEELTAFPKIPKRI